MRPNMTNDDEFFEEDQPVEEIISAYEQGIRGVTAAPICSFLFTYAVPRVNMQGLLVGQWTSPEASASTDAYTFAR
jgi:hypothetical protein